jgi:hypothetical protein
MFFLVSISSEVFQRIMMMRLVNRRLGVDASVARDGSEMVQQIRASFGGLLVVLDWRKGEVIASKPVLGASGLAVRDRTIVCASWIEPAVRVFHDGEEVATIAHRWLNYLHSVDFCSPESILLASAGSDLIAEFTFNGDVIWHWFGPEHGYGRCPDGRSAFFDRAGDYSRLRTSTAEHAMHVTSAIGAAGNTVLATLFHQGELIAIDRASGAAKVLLSGLAKPHGVHRRAGGFLLSDTLGHRVILLDDNLEVCSQIPCGSQWLQDSIVTGAGTYLTLENVHIDQLPEPHVRNRISEIDGSGRELRGVEVDVDSRLFAISEIDGALAHKLANVWGMERNFDAWRWR